MDSLHMKTRLFLLSTTSALIALPAQTLAQDSQSAESPPADEQSEQGSNSNDGVIVVEAERLRGQLLTEQPPVLELDAADIEGIGASSIAELVEAIEPQTGSARGRGGGGRPIFLVNGIRIASFREFRSYPPESVAKVEVFPEEVAQRFGFAPDRRVVNFILKENYSSREIEAEYEQPGIGGFSRTEQEFTLLQITGGGRLNLNLEASDTSLLTEDERDLIQPAGSIPDVATDPDPAAFRSLIADSAQIEATANYAKAFTDNGSSISINGTFERSDSRSLSGLDSVFLTSPTGETALRTFGANDPLERRNRTHTYSTAGTYQQPLWGFQFTATADASYTDSASEIDRRADTTALVDAAAAGTLAIDGALPAITDGGFDVAQSDVMSVSSRATLRGGIADLPAGELTTTFRLAYDWDRIESEDTRTPFDTKLTRGDLAGRVNVVLPIASSRRDVWDAIGSISLNGQAGFNHLSDFGTLNDWSLGLNWQPTEKLSLQATYIRSEAAPGLSQLGAPEIETLNVPTFDFQRGETVLATIISGGNPGLLAETQADWKFVANWQLPFIDNTRVTVDYVVNRSDNVTSSFPLLTEEIEQAFPGRVTRSAAGQLLAIDRRPITFFETRAKRLSFGLSTRGSFAQPARGAGRGEGRGGAGRGGPRGPRGEGRAGARRGERPDGAPQRQEGGERPAGQRPNAPPAEGQAASGQNAESQRPEGRRGGRGAAMASRMLGRGNRGGRYFISFNHTIELENEVLIAPGGPLLDQLDGDALSGSGLVQHSSRLESGVFYNGVGMRVSARYIGSTSITGSGAPGSSDLFFDDLATVNLRLFADLGRVFDKQDGPLKGLRISFRANNIFDGRRRVTDGNGDTPIQFQPLRVDPTGRYLGVQLRKLF